LIRHQKSTKKSAVLVHLIKSIINKVNNDSNMEPKRRWLGPPQTFDAEVKIVSGGRISIPRWILRALGLEVGHTVLLHVTTTRVHGRRAVEINMRPGDEKW